MFWSRSSQRKLRLVLWGKPLLRFPFLFVLNAIFITQKKNKINKSSLFLLHVIKITNKKRLQNIKI